MPSLARSLADRTEAGFQTRAPRASLPAGAGGGQRIASKRMTLTFDVADADRDRALLTELNVQYPDWLDADISRDFGITLPSLPGPAPRPG